MFEGKSYAKWFIENKAKDNFFNLKRVEDASTIYHGELKGGANPELSYWCEPPAGLFGDDEYILVVYGPKASIMLGCKKDSAKYRILIKNPQNFPKVLRDGGFNPNEYYPEMDIPDILRLIN